MSKKMCLFYEEDESELNNERLSAKFTRRSLLPMINIKDVAGENEYKNSEIKLKDSECMFNFCNKMALEEHNPAREESDDDETFEKSFNEMSF